ncbi:hypothetical protein B0H10DRAFT_2434248 [Mycena sp. CBHHK59/15]|nr:hypothetical protein B0H10DRAFT_2434248 [Mycena sp. CBHHK59/15]
MYYLNNISLMLAEPKLATLPWSADNGALTWTLLEHLQKKENFVVLFGKQDPNAVVVVDRGKEDVAESHVITHAVAAMNFCRSETANLQPLARGILYFGSSAPVELMNYNCRIGSMPAPQTTRRSMIALSNEEANITKAHSADPDTVGFLLVDNCQNYHKQNDLRVGRESVMNVGMAGLYFEAADVDPAVFDLADKRKRIAQADSELVGSLMFVEALALMSSARR